MDLIVIHYLVLYFPCGGASNISTQICDSFLIQNHVFDQSVMFSFTEMSSFL
jgi:hypothetical protein